ncbi:hypothetical protein P7C73_g5506, partial [Tremellales sp. Uapishka_1]
MESKQNRTKEIGMWYNVLLSWPVFIVCFWINVRVAMSSIDERLTLSGFVGTYHHPAGADPPPPILPTSACVVFNDDEHEFVVDDEFAHAGLADRRLYSNPPCDPVTATRGETFGFSVHVHCECVLLFRVDIFVQEVASRAEYEVHAREVAVHDWIRSPGLAPTVLSTFGSPLVRLALFELIYPFVSLSSGKTTGAQSQQFVIQALLSRPSSQASLLPSIPPSPVEQGDPFVPPSTTGWLKEPRVPLFYLAQYALVGVNWLEQAIGRDRQKSFTRERGGKRVQ